MQTIKLPRLQPRPPKKQIQETIKNSVQHFTLFAQEMWRTATPDNLHTYIHT
jgi:hypothetical protein